MTPLWKPSRKPEHDASLKRFIDKFNQTPPTDITMSMFTEEKFKHDGIIDLWGVTVRYDWEKREDWQDKKFPFATLGQFERKFAVEKGIELTIQCNIGETQFVVAWHRSFDEVVDISRKTEYEYTEEGKMMTTRKFEIFSYGDMTRFKKWLLATYKGKLDG